MSHHGPYRTPEDQRDRLEWETATRLLCDFKRLVENRPPSMVITRAGDPPYVEPIQYCLGCHIRQYGLTDELPVHLDGCVIKRFHVFFASVRKRTDIDWYELPSAIREAVEDTIDDHVRPELTTRRQRNRWTGRLRWDIYRWGQD